MLKFSVTIILLANAGFKWAKPVEFESPNNLSDILFECQKACTESGGFGWVCHLVTNNGKKVVDINARYPGINEWLIEQIDLFNES